MGLSLSVGLLMLAGLGLWLSHGLKLWVEAKSHGPAELVVEQRLKELAVLPIAVEPAAVARAFGGPGRRDLGIAGVMGAFLVLVSATLVRIGAAASVGLALASLVPLAALVGYWAWRGWRQLRQLRRQPPRLTMMHGVVTHVHQGPKTVVDVAFRRDGQKTKKRLTCPAKVHRLRPLDHVIVIAAAQGGDEPLAMVARHGFNQKILLTNQGYASPFDEA